VNQAACTGDTPVCSGGSCQCSSNDVRCQGSTPQRCNNGAWQSQTTCSGDTPVCVDATATCVCANNDARCQGSTPQRCSNGAWQNQPACTGDTPVCVAATATCVCANNDVRCQGSTPQRCNNGAWQSQSACSGDTPVCVDATGSCACTNGAVRCAPESGSAARQRCNGGVWESYSACTGIDPLCIGQGSCGCVPTTTRCDTSHAVASCRNNNTWLVSPCNNSLPVCHNNGASCVHGGTSPNHVACGNGLVCASDEQCCWNSQTSTGACQPDSPTGNTCALTPNDFEYDCDGPSDCGSGQVCCLTAYMRQTTQCLAPSQCMSAGTQSIVCDVAQGTLTNPSCATGQGCFGITNGIIYRCQ
jgi:hypothetical protein